MSSVSFPVTRPAGRALVVGSAACRAQAVGVLQRLGFACAEIDDPYAAVVELCRRPLVYRAIILSLQSLFREELAVIATLKRRFPHVEVWLTQTDGRQASLAEAMRLGADGLLGEDGLHRAATATALDKPVEAPAAPATSAPQPPQPQPASAPSESSRHYDMEESAFPEPVLTAEELRALLQEQTALPPDSV